MADTSATPADGAVRLSAHPRARRHIALAKGWGGLGTFLIALLLSHRAGLPTGDVLLRGVLVGIGGYVVGWMLSVAIWRQLALAEIEGHRRRLLVELDLQTEAARARLRDPGSADATAQR